MSVPSESPTAATDRQVLVVGGSVEGLATAAFLGRRGLSPVVVTTRDDHGANGTDSDAVLWSTAVSLFAELGLAETLLTSTETIREWVLGRADDGRTERLTRPNGDRRPWVTVSRSRLRALFRSELTAASVRLSKTPTRLQPTDTGLLVEFEDGVSERFDVVVGGDGARSWVRRSRFDTDPPAAWGTKEWSIRVDRRLGLPGTVYELWTPDGTFACGPLGSTDHVRYLTTDAETTDLDLDAVARQLSTTFDPDVLPSGGISPSDLTVVAGTAASGVRSEQWTADRSALLGSAARSLPPTAPLDPSLSIEDAYVLADELAGSTDAITALDRYERRRRGRHRALWRDVSFDCRRLCDALGSCGFSELRDLRAALLRSWFAHRMPAQPVDAVNQL
jgi:2-polyprenyl-6-methoxyphenol hydroxylase-like FAD-dependent oxidoreductase